MMSSCYLIICAILKVPAKISLLFGGSYETDFGTATLRQKKENCIRVSIVNDNKGCLCHSNDQDPHNNCSTFGCQTCVFHCTHSQKCYTLLN